jgi:hypothetical protein
MTDGIRLQAQVGYPEVPDDDLGVQREDYTPLPDESQKEFLGSQARCDRRVCCVALVALFAGAALIIAGGVECGFSNTNRCIRYLLAGSFLAIFGVGSICVIKNPCKYFSK